MNAPLRDESHPRTGVDLSTTGAAEGLYGSLEATLREEGDFHLSWSMPDSEGLLMHVDVQVAMTPDHSLDAKGIVETIRKSCSSYFEYALSSRLRKTFIGGLEDQDGRCVGDIVASFRPGFENARAI
jgi:hypothetical protein